MRISDWSSDVCSSDLVADLNLEVANHALRNREQGVSACCIDFSESDWKVEEVFELIRKKFDGGIYLQDRRNVGVMDFVDTRALMVDFLATLDKRGGMAVRASRIRMDGEIGKGYVWTTITNEHIVCRRQ